MIGCDEKNTGTTYLIFLLKMHNLNPIIRKIRQTPNKELIQNNWPLGAKVVKVKERLTISD